MPSLLSAPPSQGITAENSNQKRSSFVVSEQLRAAGQAGLSQEDWYEKAKELGIGIKRHADLYDIREALKAKRLVHEYGGRWNCTV
jgi:hypothetical protein